MINSLSKYIRHGYNTKKLTGVTPVLALGTL